MELSNLVRHKLRTVIIVLDNRGYGTERLLHPGDWKFNDIQPWAYHRLPELLGGGRGYEICTEGDFDAALRAAWTAAEGPSILQVHIDPGDSSQSLARLAERMSKTVVQTEYNSELVAAEEVMRND
jgi:indolepyruvate decarboxylase